MKQGIIKKFVPIIGYSKLGYKNMVFLLVKLNKHSLIEEFKKRISKHPNRFTTVEASTKYDLFLAFIFKDEKDKNKGIIKILEKYKNMIADHQIVEPYYVRLYPLKLFGSKEEGRNLWIDYHKGRIQIDDKEKQILKILNQNARARIIDIAKKTKISAELIIYKIKRLQKEGVLLGSRTIFDMDKLGYYYTLLQISIKNLSQEISERLEDFAKNSSYIDTFYLSISKPNCYMQLFHKTEGEFRKTLEDLKKDFAEEFFDIEIIPLKNGGEDINVLPFF